MYPSAGTRQAETVGAKQFLRCPGPQVSRPYRVLQVTMNTLKCAWKPTGSQCSSYSNSDTRAHWEVAITITACTAAFGTSHSFWVVFLGRHIAIIQAWGEQGTNDCLKGLPVFEGQLWLLPPNGCVDFLQAGSEYQTRSARLQGCRLNAHSYTALQWRHASKHRMQGNSAPEVWQGKTTVLVASFKQTYSPKCTWDLME